MDIKLEKKPWYIRYRYYLAGGVAFLAFLIYVITLSLGPSKLRIEQDNIQIAEVKNGKFMEYVDVEEVIQPWKCFSGQPRMEVILICLTLPWLMRIRR